MPRFAMTSLCIAMCILCMVTVTTSYPNAVWTGDTLDSVCLNMLPQHSGTLAQTVAAPYKIILNRRAYSKGSNVTVTLTGSDGSSNFKGFILQARSVLTGELFGSFNPPIAPALYKYNCVNVNNAGESSTVTHLNNNVKAFVSVVWTAPDDDDFGNIEFVYTVVKDTATYWVEETSDSLAYSRAAHLELTLVTVNIMLAASVLSGLNM